MTIAIIIALLVVFGPFLGILVCVAIAATCDFIGDFIAVNVFGKEKAVFFE